MVRPKSTCRRKFWKTTPFPAKPETLIVALGFYGFFWEISGFLGKFRGFFGIFGKFSFNLTGFRLIQLKQSKNRLFPDFVTKNLPQTPPYEKIDEHKSKHPRPPYGRRALLIYDLYRPSRTMLSL